MGGVQASDLVQGKASSPPDQTLSHEAEQGLAVTGRPPSEVTAAPLARLPHLGHSEPHSQEDTCTVLARRLN